MKYFIFVALLTTLIPACISLSTHSKTFEVQARHPALHDGELFSVTLTQLKDANGAPHEYFTDVKSVSCGDDVCAIITVRIFWDALGGYLRYELPDGDLLTKHEHKPFTVEDHAQLHQILGDADSRLKNFVPDSLAANSNRGDKTDIDAVTNPTPLFYQESVVKGAIYTCYTLWHWVNGNLPEIVFSTTVESCTEEHLFSYLKSNEARFYKFACQQLAARNKFDELYTQAILEERERGGIEFTRGAIEYFESALKNGDTNLYCDAFLKIFEISDSAERILCLRSLMANTFDPPQNFYNKLAAFLPKLDAYFELHLLLNILVERAGDSDDILNYVVAVLKNENFLMARRAYWFLEERKLTEEQAQIVAEFEAKHGKSSLFR